MKIKLRIEYDGSCFAGWQWQPETLTVQGELERGLQMFLHSWAKRFGIHFNRTPTVTASGRTDAGVHARGQVVSFDWPEGLPFDGTRLVTALNGICRSELGIIDAQIEEDEFEPRLNTHIKQYSYHILLRNYSKALNRGKFWAIGAPLDIKAMIEAAHSLVGCHDFSSFKAADCSSNTSVRTVYLSEIARPNAEELVYYIQGKGFLKQMVRIIVGTLVEIGCHKREINDIEVILNSRNRVLAGRTAPACGLVLDWVKYAPPTKKSDAVDARSNRVMTTS